MKSNPYFIGLCAAGAFAVMMLVFSGLGIFLLIPVLFGALPIYVATLGWGTRAGIVATLGIIIFATIATDPVNGLLIGMTVAAPAALAGHQANLAQPGANGSGDMVWFPMANILFSITLLIAGAIIVFGLMIDFDPAELGPKIAARLEPLLLPVEGRTPMSTEQLSEAFTLNLRLLPFVLPSFWVGIHVLNLLMGIRITRRLGVLARPASDIAGEFNMPPRGLVFVIVALAGMGLSAAPISYGFAVIAGAFIMAFSVVGLALLHQRSRNWTVRLPLLVLIYMLIFMLFFPIYLFSFSGAIKSFGLAAAKPSNPDN